MTCHYMEYMELDCTPQCICNAYT